MNTLCKPSYEYNTYKSSQHAGGARGVAASIARTSSQLGWNLQSKLMLLGGFLPLLSCSSAPPAADWAVPNSLPTNSSDTRVFIVGRGFEMGRASPASCTLISGSWDLDAEASVPVAATVHNATHASCVPPRMRLGGTVHLTLTLTNDTAGKVAVPLEYYPLLSATVARRPYTSERDGAVLVRVHSSVLAPTVGIELLLATGPTHTLLRRRPRSRQTTTSRSS
eukprot:COSAG03_NODE_3473_length_1991_cov_6.022967_1_plen_223_part_00